MIVGIDLGTSTSEVAYINDSGEVVVIPNLKDELITPSVVHITSAGKVIVGTEAAEYLFTRPDSTYMEVKRTFGTNQKFMCHGKIYSPEDLQAYIIEYLVDCAEEYIGEEVTGAVITVPAYFTDIQRRQTIRAGQLAGIEVKRVINEPTAAALDYGLQNLLECEHILVYDFGGGTLDVTVLELFEGVIDVKASSGNNQLGGKDIDEALMKHIAGKNYADLVKDPKSEMKLKHAATQCKIALSDQESAQVLIPLLTSDISIDLTVTRSEFEALIKTMVESTGNQIDSALADAKLTSGDISRVILVGGTTRIPYVKKYVQKKMGIELEVLMEGDFTPELMVVRGAAIQAGIIGGAIEEEESVVLADVCPFTLGIKMVTPRGLICDPLIKRNITIPYTFSKVYYALEEYQRAIDFEIYQGEFESPFENMQIGSLYLDKLPRRRNERAQAEVTFSYDINGVLNVKARAVKNDNTVMVDIDMANNDFPVQLPVKLKEWTKADGSTKYRPLLRKVEKTIEEYEGDVVYLEQRLFFVKELCDGLKADLIRGEMDEAEAKAVKLRDFNNNWTPPEDFYDFDDDDDDFDDLFFFDDDDDDDDDDDYDDDDDDDYDDDD